MSDKWKFAAGLMEIAHPGVKSPVKKKAAMDIVEEIAMLELEVRRLERHLLSLYRKAFDQQVASLSTIDNSINQTAVMVEKDNGSSSAIHSARFHLPQDLLGESCGIHRSQSSLSERSAYAFRSPLLTCARGPESLFHSLPFSAPERVAGATSIAVYFGEHALHTSDHAEQTANWLSEEMIKCISSIYCSLAEPPISPVSFGPSARVSALVEVEVRQLCRDSKKLSDIEPLLEKYRLLIESLGDVNLANMKHEEKLAFWINVHNALLMHALLVYGIPQSFLKRRSLLLKAAYNVGGHTINAETIQTSILGCQLPHLGHWFRVLFHPKTKFRIGDKSKVYAIDQSEPLLCFALCTGSHSDPMVRLYTPKSVIRELETAREEYILNTYRVHKEEKILLPKIIEYYVRNLGLRNANLMEMIEHLLPAKPRTNKHGRKARKSWKSIQWIPHNSSFRYQFSKELCDPFFMS
ncbi:hypothetical protein Ancab_027470 [Ancistrocladus abbreviatus]